MKRLLIFIVGTIFFTSLTFADNYALSVTRTGDNLYKVDGKDIFVRTRYCYEYLHYENSLLRMYGSSGEIIFTRSGGKCDVEAVYGRSLPEAGKYSVTIFREDIDWYQIWGYGMYVKTTGCLSLALGEEAILSINPAGYGTLYVGHDVCMVEGIYSKMKL